MWVWRPHNKYKNQQLKSFKRLDSSIYFSSFKNEEKIEFVRSYEQVNLVAGNRHFSNSNNEKLGIPDKNFSTRKRIFK